jgi:hypothetical protein
VQLLGEDPAAEAGHTLPSTTEKDLR